MKVIYNEAITCNNCWTLTRGFYSDSVRTFIIESKQWFFFKKYKIDQIVPLLRDPFYDGEYSTNRTLNAIANAEKKKAEIWLIEYKNGKRKNNPGVSEHVKQVLSR